MCTLADQQNMSELKVDYVDQEAVAVSLKSPGSDIYRQLPVSIEMVFKRNQNARGYEAIWVKPLPPQGFDWSKVDECFVEAGTNWYFEFSHSTNQYQVQFVLNFLVANSSCVTPHVQPQIHPLNCRGL